MSKGKDLLITPKTKVGELLDIYPQLEEVLTGLSPAFKKLKNPVIRRTVGKVATLQQAATIGNLPVTEMVNTLRAAIGQELSMDTDNGTDINYVCPGWFSEEKITGQFNAAPVINAGENPMQQIFNHLGKKGKGDIFLLITPFIPVPIIELIRNKGYAHYCRKMTEDLVHTYFYSGDN